MDKQRDPGWSRPRRLDGPMWRRAAVLGCVSHTDACVYGVGVRDTLRACRGPLPSCRKWQRYR